MSKERARARAERERAAAQRAAEQAAAETRAAQARRKREQRSQQWRTHRIWRGSARNREASGLFVTICALCLLVSYLLTRSVADVVGTALILLIVAPVLWALIHDRSRK